MNYFTLSIWKAYKHTHTDVSIVLYIFIHVIDQMKGRATKRIGKNERNRVSNVNWYECFKWFTNNELKINQSICTHNRRNRKGKEQSTKKRRRNVEKIYTHQKIWKVVAKDCAHNLMWTGHEINLKTTSKNSAIFYALRFVFHILRCFLSGMLVIVAQCSWYFCIVRYYYVELFDFISFICWSHVLQKKKSKWLLHQCYARDYRLFYLPLFYTSASLLLWTIDKKRRKDTGSTNLWMDCDRLWNFIVLLLNLYGRTYSDSQFKSVI